ncbi:MAG TPA: non-canonical purine NTP pyrophosphatase, partial [Urbifossiella sp.]
MKEFRALAATAPGPALLDLQLLPNFSALPPFDESAPTFAENAAGKALHYSRFSALPVLADDSGLVVDALGGEPGVYSARYAGPHASSADCIAKLFAQMEARRAQDRRA